jgi:tricorn protease
MADEGGYYRQPTVHDDRIVFVSDDDLWEAPLEGGRARRLTSGRGDASHPHFSPDGTQIAFTGTEEGAPEVFVMDADGGPVEQLTFHGTRSAVVGWEPDGESIVFRSTHKHPFKRPTFLHTVPADGGPTESLSFGQAHALEREPNGDGCVIGRHSDDLARWKRYRGGTAGTIWLDRQGDGQWEQFLADQDAGLVSPLWIGDRLYFISDFEGYGNIYSANLDGESLKRHTHHDDFYARFAATDGDTIVYSCGARLWRLDVGATEPEPIEVQFGSPRTERNRKFVDASEYLEDYTLHPEGHSMATTARGKVHDFGLWEGPARQHGRAHGVRYRNQRYLDEDRLLVVSDEGGEESFEIHDLDSGEVEPVDTGDFDIGRPLEVKVSPDEEHDAALFSNHRAELIHMELDTGACQVIDESDHVLLGGFDWSPDGRWIAYSTFGGWHTSEIRIAEVGTWETRAVTSGQYRDTEPVFDPEGRYLYFLSCREFDPVYDQVFLELSFPRTMKPCVVTLQEDLDSPFHETPRPLNGGKPRGGEAGDNGADSDGEDEDDSEEAGDDDASKQDVEIDFEGIGDRVETFDVKAAEYGGLDATANRVFWTVHPIEGSIGTPMDGGSDSGSLEYFSLNKRSTQTFAEGVSTFEVGPDNSTLAMEMQGRLRVVDATGKGPAQQNGGSPEPGRSTGWIDLDRLVLPVEPAREWRQMLREAWRLMRDHFWRADMTGVDWQSVWERYSRLVDRVSTRGEFSDLVWTMQGELGTSHAYEMGGDYERAPQYRPGYLGVDVEWDPDVTWERGGTEHRGGFRITHLVRGASWEESATSPLARPGVDATEGDVIVAVNRTPFRPGDSFQESLVHRSGEDLEVTLLHSGADRESDESDATARYSVELLRSEQRARYLEWVEENRERVHQATDGRVGYVHIPDMGPRGFSEFHRSFLSEQSKDGLVVDVRFNAGGHVSELILEKLARQRLGYSLPRWGDANPYPSGSITGPIVGLTNEYAGSDGDIFSHCFKMMDVGPLVGKRTWGGVVGIWPTHGLVDGSVTTQPEFASWYRDVGFGLENRGTEPDIEVGDPPGSMQNGEDPQLDAAIERALEGLDSSDERKPDFGEPPSMAPPESLPEWDG